MKKFFTVVSVLMALVFMAGPSHALVGIDDAVPGHDLIVPFIVEIGATGLDTLVMIQEISDNALLGGSAATAAGRIHWYLLDRTSIERASRVIPYSGGDVVPLSVRLMIADNVGAANLPFLLYDLNGDGTNDSYVGYIYFQNLTTVVRNNLVAYFHYADLNAGRACGAYAAMKEWTGPGAGTTPNIGAITDNNALGYNYAQIANANPTGAGTELVAFPWWLPGANTTPRDFEAFSPASYFWSSWRERGVADPVIVAALAGGLNFIRFTPRFYLHNANGESHVILWKSRNHVGAGVNNLISIFIWDENENRVNLTIPLPNELNIIRVRDYLPPAFMAAYPSGGWMDIVIAGDAGVLPAGITTAGYLQNWRYTEFLMWTWMYAADTAATLNWASLWTDRQVGTLGTAPRPE